ncbi:hypothetical protein TIFTF001_027235 [Ficus carica]|uniref:Uncharacterized protein n=1 Tax=Ficus carica TaxID=3494 RepID=A0AA88IUU7_FICCA|nr:hypothetical protein TIFTF001_027235 [Ficus carica]
MAPSKAKKIKATLERDYHDTNVSMSELNTETNDDAELMLLNLEKAIHELVQTQNVLVRAGIPKEHINRFLDALGQHAGERSFKLLSRSLPSMEPHLPEAWRKLGGLRSGIRDLDLDCYNDDDKETLVGICINNIIPREFTWKTTRSNTSQG